MGESLRPDDVIPPDGDATIQLRRLARDGALLLPNVIKLLTRLVRDPRVPRRSKLVVAAAVAYLVSPIDVIPEFIPVVGFADDLLLAAFAVNHLIAVAGEDVVLEHWDGPRDLLDMIRTILELSADLVPARVRKLVRRLSGA